MNNENENLSDILVFKKDEYVEFFYDPSTGKWEGVDESSIFDSSSSHSIKDIKE